MNKRQRLVWRTEVFEILRGVWAGKTRGTPDEGARGLKRTRKPGAHQTAKRGETARGTPNKGWRCLFFPQADT